MAEEKVTTVKAKAKTAPKKAAAKKAPVAPTKKAPVAKAAKAPAKRAPRKIDPGVISIVSDIPIPVVPLTSRSKFPCDILQPGESFFIAAKTVALAKKLKASINGVAKRVTKKSGETFLVLDVEGGVRCWRTDTPVAPTAKTKGKKTVGAGGGGDAPAPVAAAPAPAETAPVEVGLPGFDALKE